MAVVFFWPAETRAQETADEEASGLEVLGSVGFLTPLAKLADSGDTIRAEFSTKVSFGAEVDFWFGDFGVGVVGGYSSPELTVQLVPSDSIGFAQSIQLGSTDYWMFTGNLMWRPSLSGSSAIVRPYFGIGAGVVSITYPQSEGFPDIASETRFTGTLLGGAHVRLNKGWFARLDIRDYISEFNTEPFDQAKVQHDLVSSFAIGYAFH
jgi:hypothetical protein